MPVPSHMGKAAAADDILQLIVTAEAITGKVSGKPFQEFLRMISAPAGLVIIQADRRQPVISGSIQPHIRLGKNGSRAYYKDMIVKGAPFVRKDTIETTGAGDTFEACMLNYILEHGLEHLTEDNLKEMLTFANAGASIITTKKGALKVMPEREEIQEMIKKRQEKLCTDSEYPQKFPGRCR